MGEQRRGYYLYAEWWQLCVPMERASLVVIRETLWLWCTKWGGENETKGVCTSWWLSCVSLSLQWVNRQIVTSKSFLLEPWFCTDCARRNPRETEMTTNSLSQTTLLKQKSPCLLQQQSRSVLSMCMHVCVWVRAIGNFEAWSVFFLWYKLSWSEL